MGNVEEAAVAYRIFNPLKKVTADKGKSKVVPVYMWSSYQKIDAIKEGISKEELENLKDQTGLDYDTLAKVLSVTKATLHNKKGKDKFDVSVSERLLLLADIYSYGYQVFESKERFNQWMKSSNSSLGGVSPLNLLDTLYGMEEVKHLVGRIEYGVYS
ncbi:MAG TPA: antitoxin Xre/MbcA/ParS toxin-binding domain-containing protein [Chitinophagaceae bacterium]|nr:antitoxin Xre/MbcA/ParS toxin-binding domain-containing protein [Chitinophagaceae bacterium]